MGGACSRYVAEVHKGFGGEPRERDHLEDVGVDGRIILKWIFKKWDEEAWTGWSGLAEGRERGRLLRMR
jgi:hypothetical protein